jgi:hypothetical protein
MSETFMELDFSGQEAHELLAAVSRHCTASSMTKLAPSSAPAIAACRSGRN